jgi:CheY-like chemotaxis protein
MLDKIEKLKKLSILFVDDVSDIIDVISDTLEKLDVEFYVAYDGYEALKILEKEKINLLVTDINMSDIDGLELLKTIREQNNNVDCIIISAYTEENYQKIARDLNVKEYIIKPFEFNEFLNAIDKL